jgi:hypothetical protein
MKGKSSRKRLLAVIALVAFLFGASGSAASALWSARVTATGSVTVGGPSISVAPVSDQTFTNDRLSVTSAVSVTNGMPAASVEPGQVVMRFGSPSGAAIRSNAGLISWPVAEGATCDADTAAPPGATSGGWVPGLTMPPVTVMPATTQQFCVRTSFADRQSAATLTLAGAFTVSVDATLTAGAYSAAATTQTAAYRSSNIGVFRMTGNFWFSVSPFGQSTTCVGVVGGVDAAVGSSVATAPCLSPPASSANASQWLAMSQVGTDSIALRLGGTATNRVLQSNADGTLTSETYDSSDPRQVWQSQAAATNQYFLVSQTSGLCLTASATDATLTMAPCSNDPLQRFLFTQLATAPPGAL